MQDRAGSAKKYGVNDARPIDVLVTGAGGFVGSRLAITLVRKGFTVRGLLRSPEKKELLQQNGIDIRCGDIADIDAIADTFDGVRSVVHAAAGTRGSHEEMRRDTVNVTANVLELCDRFHIEKLVYISTCNVYDITSSERGSRVDESSLLELRPERRGVYTATKIAAEEMILKYMQEGGTPTVCLRPGTVYGPGGEIFTPMLGVPFREKLFVVFGNERLTLPLVYVDDLASAVIHVLQNPASDGQVYNVVDPEPVHKKRYMQSVVRPLFPKSRIVYIPYPLLYFMVWGQEKLLRLLGKKPFLTCYRLESSQTPVLYDSSKLRNELQWQPGVHFDEGAANLVQEFNRSKQTDIL